ncbi:serine/threonine-protein kinase Sgk2 [Podospora didyma]|uniref:non-specific serine/threonine protein kinase n=1 Tax=Podospora didyma TaxID=330526 RepID=A0AAE0K912_9PEZI|nr:serine/threonine-protein kinase Sgk2 [Podospora didyma]
MAQIPEPGSPLIPHVLKTDVDDILDDIDGHIHGPISRLTTKYFSKFDSILRDDVAHIMGVASLDGGCSVSPPFSSAQDFSHRSSAFSSRDLNGARGTWSTCCHPSALDSASVHLPEGAASHLFLSRSAAPFDPKTESSWRDVQVIGQFCQQGGRVISYRDGLLNLCAHAREVFANQTTRLFLHGFYLCGSLLELWVFDRSGIYGSDVVDIEKDLSKFLSIMLSYPLMSDGELGRSDIIRNDDIGSFVTLEDAPTIPLGKLYLEGQPIALSENLVGEGTTCFRAKALGSDEWTHVIKFKWRWAATRPEGTLLRLAKEKGVWGVASLDYHREFTRTAELRSGLGWRKSDRGCEETLQDQQKQPVSPKSATATGPGGLLDITEETNQFLKNRILTCLVISPAGRPLRTFKSVLELLHVFRDAIKAHRSLLQDANILHQDFSAQNIIIITEPLSDHDDPKGMLIDLDVAMDLSVGPRTPGELVGTRIFMAIGILQGRPHTYRHDLESFFYVFLWTIIINRSDHLPSDSKLRPSSPTTTTWGEVAAQKENLMGGKETFAEILAEFTPEFGSLKPLAETLRQILLFPVGIDGEIIWTGTDGTPEAVNRLYDEMIGAFEDAIAEMKRRRNYLEPGHVSI